MKHMLNMLICIVIALIFLIPPVSVAEDLSESGAAQDAAGPSDVPAEDETPAPGQDGPASDESSEEEDEQSQENNEAYMDMLADPGANRRRDDEDDDDFDPSGDESTNPVDTDVKMKSAAMSISKVSLHHSNGTATDTMDHGEEGSVSAKITNEGRETDYMTEVEVDFYYLDDEGRRTYIDRDVIPVIKGGGHSEVAEVNWTATMVAKKILVIADADGSDGGPTDYEKEININPAEYFEYITCPYPYGADEADNDIEYFIKVDNVGTNDDTVQLGFDQLTGGASWKAYFTDTGDDTQTIDVDTGAYEWVGFTVEIPSSAAKEDEATFLINIYSTGAEDYVGDMLITTYVRQDKPILLVDDDYGSGDPQQIGWYPGYTLPDTHRFMISALNDAGYEGYFDTYAVPHGGNDGPSYDVMDDYDLIIWNTGYDLNYNTVIRSNDRNNLHQVMADGNAVCISGDNIFYDRSWNEPKYGKVRSEFFRNWMNASWVHQDLGIPDIIVGHLNDPISEGAVYGHNDLFTAPQMIGDEFWTNKNDQWANGLYHSAGPNYMGVSNYWQGGQKSYGGSSEYANPYRSVFIGNDIATFGDDFKQHRDGSWGHPDRTDAVLKISSWLGVPPPFHGAYDLTPFRIDEPFGNFTDPGKTTTIAVSVANFGQRDFEGEFTLNYRVRDITASGGYGTYDEEWSEDVDLSDEGTFIPAQGFSDPGIYKVETDWSVPVTSGVKYEITVTMDAAGDLYSSNDVNLTYVSAGTRYDLSVEWPGTKYSFVGIDMEYRCGYWDLGLVGSPTHFTAHFKNNGSAEETFDVYLSIKDPFGEELRNWTRTITVLPGYIEKVKWKWTPEKAAGTMDATQSWRRHFHTDPYFISAGVVDSNDDRTQNDHIKDQEFGVVEYQEGGERGTYGWTIIDYTETGSYWHPSDHASYRDPSHAWWCGDPSEKDKGTPLYDNLTRCEARSPLIDLSPYYDVRVDILTYGQSSDYDDRSACQIKRDDEDWSEATTLVNTSSSGGTLLNGRDMDAYAGDVVQMRFWFKSDGADAYAGVTFDNFILMATSKDYFDADIRVQSLTVDPLVEDANKERTIKAEIKNVGEVETNERGTVEVEVTVRNSEGYEIDIEDARQELADNLKREESATIEWSWTPDQNGVYTVYVVAEWKDGDENVDEDLSDNNMTIEALVQHYYFIDNCENGNNPQGPGGEDYDPWEVVLEDTDGSGGDSEATQTWEVGMPDPEYDTGPRSAPSPDNCWGTNMDGPYANNGKDSECLMRTVDLRIAKEPYLMFNHWLEIEGGYDYAYVEVREYVEGSLEDEPWTQLWTNPEGEDFYYRTDGWESMQLNLGDWAFKNIQIRFRLMTDVSTTYAGWYLDDIAVSGVQPFIHDLRANYISSPVDGESYAPGTTINIKGTISNIGSQFKQKQDVTVKFTIDEYWGGTKQQTVKTQQLDIPHNLESGMSVEVNFNWKIIGIGSGGDDVFYRINMEAVLERATDEDPGNNMKFIDIFPRKLHNMTMNDLYGSPQIQDVGRPRIITAEVTNNGNVPQDFFVTFTVRYDDTTALDNELVEQETIVGNLLPGESGQVTWNWTARKYATYMLEGAITLPEGEDEYFQDDNNMSASGDEKSLYTRIKLMSDSGEHEDPVNVDNLPWDYETKGAFWNSPDNKTGHDGAAGWHRVYDRVNPRGFNSGGAWYVGRWPQERYVPNMDVRLTSSAINLGANEDVTLSFMTKFYVEGWNYDNLYVYVRSQNFNDWHQLDKIPHKYHQTDNPRFDLKDSSTYSDNDEGWILKDYTIDDKYVENGFQLQFRFVSDSGTEYDGLYLDDITLHARESAENHKPIARFRASSQGSEASSWGYVMDPDYADRHFISLPHAQQELLTHLPSEGGIDISSGAATVVFDASYAYDPDRYDDDLIFHWDFGTGEAPVETTQPIYVYEGYDAVPDDGSDYYTVTLEVEDESGAISDHDTMKVYIGNQEPYANFTIIDIGGTRSKLVPVGKDADQHDIYEIFWGDTLKFQSEAEDPENRDQPGRGISLEKWDFEYTGEFDETYNLSGASFVEVTVGQNDHFVYNPNTYLTEDGLPVLYESGWDKDLPMEYAYLREIVTGKLQSRARIFLPPPPIGTPDAPEFIDYTMRFVAVDDQGAKGENVIVLRVKPFAQRTFYQAVEDEMGNIFDAQATLTWRGNYEEAASKASSINAQTPVFVFINGTTHPQGLKEDGELGIYYNVDVVGTHMQDPTEFGFCNITVGLPYSGESLDEVGIVDELKERVKVYYWEERSFSFLALDDTKTEPKMGVFYATATIDDDLTKDHMPIAPLVYTLHDDIDKAELKVEDIAFSRTPALPGNKILITATLANTGVVHAYDVPVRFTVNTLQILLDSVDLPAGERVKISAYYNISEDIVATTLLQVSVLVDPHNEVSETNENNNLGEAELYVVKGAVSVSSFATTVVIVGTTLVICAAMVAMRERRRRRR